MHSAEQLTINFPSTEQFTLDVIDVQGRCCAVISDCSGIMNFTAAQLGINSGMYLLRATSSNTTHTSRLIIHD
jgi:hypothetical protein